ncbi:DNA repair protein RecO [Coralloluteibacterium stylophorae]|uniref:DNA repair protein RecO n=1 Tax=Coralloluteibacterium stylophorae TaxID=1776034 RepID=A0A8J7VVA9_9GAMM|nr:DNA repair protein RecO [Coralloluteibacterium stylophorae]MBS7458617.1 DNA repair protein RecO [Coralloluteibacterium stylophorae]
MRVEAQPAFILHATAYRETSLLVEALTRDHGRVGLIARGVRGAKRQPLRAALQPLQAVLLDYAQKGELATLARAEPVAPLPAPAGEALLAGFYLSELVLRLAPRNDAVPDVFDLFATTLAALSDPHVRLAWSLRRFERDLLDALGYGLPLTEDAAGLAVDPQARYRLDPEQGPVREPRPVVRSVPGTALLALAADREPDAAGLRALRDALREVIAHHLGPRGLKSWGMPGEFARLLPPGPAPDGP